MQLHSACAALRVDLLHNADEALGKGLLQISHGDRARWLSTTGEETYALVYWSLSIDDSRADCSTSGFILSRLDSFNKPSLPVHLGDGLFCTNLSLNLGSLQSSNHHADEATRIFSGSSSQDHHTGHRAGPLYGVQHLSCDWADLPSAKRDRSEWDSVCDLFRLWAFRHINLRLLEDHGRFVHPAKQRQNYLADIHISIGIPKRDRSKPLLQNFNLGWPQISAGADRRNQGRRGLAPH